MPALRSHLELDGHEVLEVRDGSGAMDAISDPGADLVLLDLKLPGNDSLEFLQRFRGRGRREPVVVLSAWPDPVDKLISFRSGADDFITIPVDLMEFLVRVERLLHRTSGTARRPDPVAFGSVRLHKGTRTVLRNGKEIHLSPKEFDLAVALIERAGTVISRADLLRQVWGYKAQVRTRTVDSHVFQLRRKLEDQPSRPQHFISVFKVGYRFEF